MSIPVTFWLSGNSAQKNLGRCFALYHLIDRADRLDLSVFRVVIGMLERMLDNPRPFSIPLFPYFT